MLSIYSLLLADNPSIFYFFYWGINKKDGMWAVH